MQTHLDYSSSSSKFNSHFPKIKTLIIPIEDRSKMIDELSIREIDQIWQNDLEKQGIIIKVNPLLLAQPNTFLAREDSLNLYKLGIHLKIIPEILDFKIQTKSSKRGLIRYVLSEVEIKMKVQMINTKTGQQELNKIKTIVIEDSKIRWPQENNNEPHLFWLENKEIIKNHLVEALLELNHDIISKMERFHWEGRIALVQGDRVYLNVGEQTGLKIGDLLKVSDLGDEIFDPQSGRFIGRTPGRPKGTIEVISFFGEDGAIAIIHSGSDFKENDRVELNW